MTQQPTNVSTLLGRKHISMAERCLGSLLRYSSPRPGLVIHEDGSLNQDDVARLRTTFENSTVIMRPEADERMASLLSGHRRCAEFRREHVLGLKLLDTVLLSDSPVISYCDTDVLFFRPFQDLFEVPENCDALFMLDVCDAFSLRSWTMAWKRLSLISRVNTGLMCFRRECFDLDRLEWFLRLPSPPVLRHWYEQTAWAFLAAGVRTRMWNPRQVRLVCPGVAQPDEIVAGHYVATYRHLLDQVPSHLSQAVAADPVVVRTIAAQRCGAWTIMNSEIRRPLHRKLPWLGLVPADGYCESA